MTTVIARIFFQRNTRAVNIKTYFYLHGTEKYEQWMTTTSQWQSQHVANSQSDSRVWCQWLSIPIVVVCPTLWPLWAQIKATIYTQTLTLNWNIINIFYVMRSSRIIYMCSSTPVHSRGKYCIFYLIHKFRDFADWD